MSAPQTPEQALWTRLGALAEDGVSRLDGDAADPLVLTRPGRIPPLLKALHDDAGLAFTGLVDLTAIDRWPERPRFELVYRLHSPDNGRLQVRAAVEAPSDPLPSVASIYSPAEWLEREISEFFGLTFAGHGTTKPLVLPDGFQGHPLRKDFSEPPAARGDER